MRHLMENKESVSIVRAMSSRRFRISLLLKWLAKGDLRHRHFEE
jgi:hypothetical protein